MKPDYCASIQGDSSGLIPQNEHRPEEADLNAQLPTECHQGPTRTNSELFVIYNPTFETNLPLATVAIPESILPSESICHNKPSNIEEHTQHQLARFSSVSLSDGIRLATVLFCLGWFIFNSYTILKEYQDHDTIVFLDYQRPSKSNPPAITICTHCVICSLDSIHHLPVSTVLKSDDIWGIQHKSPNPNITIDPSKDVDISCTFSGNTLFHQGTTIAEINCTDLVNVVVSMQEGHKCFTYFSDIYGNLTKQIKNKPQYVLHYDLQPSINLQIGGYFVMGSPTDYIKLVNKNGKPGPTYTGMYLSIHDPTILPDMYDLNFHVITPGLKTIFRFNKRVQKLQPPPYKTMCYDYKLNRNKHTTQQDDSDETASNSEMQGSDLSNYQSRGECFLFCMWRDLNLDKCANSYSIFTGEMERKDNTVRLLKRLQNIAKQDQALDNSVDTFDSSDNVVDRIKFCPKDNHSFDEYVHTKEKCLNECPDGCEIDTYSQQDIQNIKWTKGDKTVDNYGNKGLVNIRWATQPVVNIVHRPKLELTEFLGTLGGHAHIWLGLSVIHVVWFVIRLVRHFLPETSWCDIVQCWKFCVGRRRKLQM